MFNDIYFYDENIKIKIIQSFNSLFLALSAKHSEGLLGVEISHSSIIQPFYYYNDTEGNICRTPISVVTNIIICMPFYLRLNRESETFVGPEYIRESLEISAIKYSRNVQGVLRLLNAQKDAGLLNAETTKGHFIGAMHHNNPLDLLHLIKLIRSAGLLTNLFSEKNIDAVIKLSGDSIVEITKAIEWLNTNHLLTQDNFEQVITNPFPKKRSNIIESMERLNLDIDTSQRNTLLNHNDPQGAIDVFQILNTEDLLISKNIQSVLLKIELMFISKVLKLFCRLIPLNQEYFDTILHSENLMDIVLALTLLETTSLLNDLNGKLVLISLLKNPYSFDVVKTIHLLQHRGLIEALTLDTIVNHRDGESLYKALTILYKVDLLKGEHQFDNMSTVIKHPYLIDFAHALSKMEATGSFKNNAQEKLNVLSKAMFPILVGDGICELSKAESLMAEHAAAYLNAVVESRYPKHHALMIIKMHAAGLLSDLDVNASKIRKAIFEHPFPSPVADIFILFKKISLLTGLATEEYHATAIQHQNPWGILCAINTLEEGQYISEVLTQGVFLSIIGSNDPQQAACDWISSRSFKTMLTTVQEMRTPRPPSASCILRVYGKFRHNATQSVVDPPSINLDSGAQQTHM